MPASRRILLRASSVLTLLLALLWWSERHHAGSLSPAPTRAQAVADVGAPPLEVPSPPAATAVAPVGDPRGEYQDPPEPAAGANSGSGAPRAATLGCPLHGTVVGVHGKLPLEGVIVEAATEVDSPLGPARTALTARTDSDGRFTLLLYSQWPQDVPWDIEVSLPGSEGSPIGRIHGKRRLLVEGMEILVELGRIPHGVARFDPARPEGDLTVEILGEGERFPAGASAVAADGSFELNLGTRLLLAGEFGALERCRLRCRSGRFSLGEVEVGLERLMSDAGAVVTFRLFEVELRILGAERPQPAMIAVYPPSSTRESLFSTQQRVPDSIRFSTYANVVVVRASTPYLQAPDQTVRLHEGRLNVVEVHLQPRADGELVRGRVFDERGAPVNEAIVEAFPPPDPQRAFQRPRFASSDRDGAFELRLDPDKVWTIEARRMEAADRITWKHADGIVQLRLEPTASLNVLLHAEDVFMALIASDGSARFEQGSRLSGIVPGDYRLFLRTRSPAISASEPVSFTLGEQKNLTLDAHAANWAEAHLSSDSGESGGLEVVLDAPDWPEALRLQWGRAWTAADGSFELFLGERAVARVHVLRDGVDLSSFELRADVTNELRVP
jgi:hypothetical protein